MQRFFVTFPLSIDIKLTDPMIISQITRVLRSKIGDHIVLFNGDRTETEYEIQNIEKKSIGLRGIAKRAPKTELSKNIALYQGMPNKYEKIEYILQKGVEVGITKFVFFRSERSQKLLLSPSKIERFYIIAKEALEQCGGLVIPEIKFLDSISKSDCIEKAAIVLDTMGNLRSISEFSNLQDVGIFVGPEGGWSENERRKMFDYGFIFAHFGERILRTETAGVAIAFGLFHI